MHTTLLTHPFTLATPFGHLIGVGWGGEGPMVASNVNRFYFIDYRYQKIGFSHPSQTEGAIMERESRLLGSFSFSLYPFLSLFLFSQPTRFF